MPICSQFRLYICWENSLGEFVKNKTHRFQCFSANGVIIKRVCGVLAWLFYNVVHGEVFSNIAHSQVMLYFNECNLSVPEANLTKIRNLPIPNLSDKKAWCDHCTACLVTEERYFSCILTWTEKRGSERLKKKHSCHWSVQFRNHCYCFIKKNKSTKFHISSDHREIQDKQAESLRLNEIFN